MHTCPNGGLVLDRDHNTALNIEKAGLAQTGLIPVKYFFTPVTCRSISRPNIIKNACEDDVRPCSKEQGLITLVKQENQ